jgi:hypothetical protein
MVQGKDGAVGRWRGQDLAQPVDLCAADPPVALARNHGVKGDDPVSGHKAHAARSPSAESSLARRLINTRRVNVATAQYLGERLPLVVVAGAEDRRDAALTRETADEFKHSDVRLTGPVVRDVAADHNHVDILDLAAIVQYPAQRLPRVDSGAVRSVHLIDVGVRQSARPDTHKPARQTP